MGQRARVLVVGGILLGLIVVGLVIGFVLVGGNDNNVASPSPSPSATDVRTQVEQAYLHYWDVYAAAMLNLDASHLPEVLAEDALANHRAQIEEQRRKNQPVRIEVEHSYRITLISADKASIEDNYINHSVRLDPTTKQPIESPPNTRVRRTYTLKRVNGIWKVTLVVGFR